MQGMMHILLVSLIVFVIGLAAADPAAEIPNSLQDLNIKGLPDLSNITQDYDPEEALNKLNEKCKKNSKDPDAFKKAVKASEDVQECVKKIVNMTEIQEKIEKAKPTGDLDVVFKQYCQQSPALKKCVFDMTDIMEACLDPEEVKTKKTVHNITDSLVDFICFKDGDRIALFIAEGGPQCLNSSAPAMKTCAEKAFGYKLDGEVPNIDALPQLILQAKECEKFTVLQKCIVNEMEKCNETTPANVIDSLFNFIRRQTPCQDILAKKTGSGASVNYGVVSTAILSALLLFSLT